MSRSHSKKRERAGARMSCHRESALLYTPLRARERAFAGFLWFYCFFLFRPKNQHVPSGPAYPDATAGGSLLDGSSAAPRWWPATATAQPSAGRRSNEETNCRRVHANHNGVLAGRHRPRRVFVFLLIRVRLVAVLGDHGHHDRVALVFDAGSARFAGPDRGVPGGEKSNAGAARHFDSAAGGGGSAATGRRRSGAGLQASDTADERRGRAERVLQRGVQRRERAEPGG
uniref:(northern house mosquito) hypothetical protein n=2 Tax=Culex pipiens TaxID=7175 RepID=A0A8D8C0Z0_CULPI